MQSVRHSSKAVTRHRKYMHILKQKLMTVTEYIPPKPTAPPGALTPHVKPVQEECGLVLLLKKELQTMFQDCKMIALAIKIKFIPNQVMRSYLSDSPYINMGPLFIGQAVIFVSKEPKVKEMLLSLRTSPQMRVLNDAKLSSVTLVLGELVSGLTMLTS
ncbi:hypothetical protein J4Q44_G00280780 [Coregonus suidteri]|uniref:Large ribosomal subunit protein uL10m n=1 Tax=Coregonus suidteri TaxID=861788 RepID=A0AAN8L5I9_9TELE